MFTFSTLSKKISVLNFTTVKYFCTTAVKRYYAINNNLPFMYHLFSRVLEYIEAKKTFLPVLQTSVCLIYSLKTFAAKIVPSRDPKR